MGLCALGIVFLVFPMFVGSSPMLNTVATALRTPAWLALFAGLALLGIHHFIKAKAAQATPPMGIGTEATVA